MLLGWDALHGPRSLQCRGHPSFSWTLVAVSFFFSKKKKKTQTLLDAEKLGHVIPMLESNGILDIEVGMALRAPALR
jgi:hypothetical protein